MESFEIYRVKKIRNVLKIFYGGKIVYPWEKWEMGKGWGKLLEQESLTQELIAEKSLDPFNTSSYPGKSGF